MGPGYDIRHEQQLHALELDCVPLPREARSPVPYGRTPTRLVPVDVVRDSSGNQWFIWGRTRSAHVSRVTGAAAELCENGRVTSEDVSRSRVNLVAARRAMLRGAA